MELQFKSSACRFLAPAVREVTSAELTQEVRLSDGLPDIGRVLSSWGQIILRSKEWQQDQVTVSGGVMAWILYAPEDGTQPRSVDVWVPFQLKWYLADAPRDGTVRVSPVLRSVDSRSISARKMMIRASVAAFGEACYPSEAEIYVPDEIPEDIQILSNTYPVRLPLEMGEKTFLLDEDLALPNGAEPVERILSHAVTPILQEKRVAGDKVIMRGSVMLHMVYSCAEGKIKTADLEVPISQYAQLEDTFSPDALADIQPAVTSLELDKTDGNQLRLKCGLVAQYIISDRFLASVAEDAYSPRRNVEAREEVLYLPSILEQRIETVPIQQQLPGITGEIVDAAILPDFPHQSRTGDQIVFDLPAVAQVLYYAEDGSLQSANVRWEGNMQIGADADCQMDMIVQPHHKVQAISGASELSLVGEYKVQFTATSNRGLPAVTGLEIGECREPDPARPSLILCRADGENLWSIAKRCGSTVSAIQNANDLQEDLRENRMLLIPVI